MANGERLIGSVEVLTSESGPRRFRMLANTGAAFERRYGKTVADLSAMTVPKKLPILLNHDENAVVGYADRHELTSEGLVLHGKFVDEPAAARVQKLSDSGFPLSASVGVRDIQSKTLSEGTTTRLNGKDFSGPLTVWAKSSLFESSFVTANPADMNTTAAALVEESPMTADEFAKANPEAVKTWKAEGAKVEREALTARVQAFSAKFKDRPAFALERLAAGDTLEAAQIAENELLKAELVEARKAPAQAAAPTTLDRLKEKAGSPALGFDGAAREKANGTTERLDSLAPEERAKAELGADATPDSVRRLAAFYRAEKAGLIKTATVDKTRAAFEAA